MNREASGKRLFCFILDHISRNAIFLEIGSSANHVYKIRFLLSVSAGVHIIRI